MMSLQQQLEALKAKAQAKTEQQPATPAPAQVADPPFLAMQQKHGATGVNPPSAASWGGSPQATKPAPKPQTAALPWGQPAQAPAPAQELTVKETAAIIEKAHAHAQAQAPAETASSVAPWGQPAQTREQMSDAFSNTLKAMVPQVPEPVTAFKPKKTREKTAPASADGSLSVIFAAAVLKFPDGKAKPAMLIDLLGPIMRKVADENSVAHWALIPYAQGRALLAHEFDAWLTAAQWKGTILVGDSDEARAVHEVLTAHADVIVRGTRS